MTSVVPQIRSITTLRNFPALKRNAWFPLRDVASLVPCRQRMARRTDHTLPAHFATTHRCPSTEQQTLRSSFQLCGGAFVTNFPAPISGRAGSDETPDHTRSIGIVLLAPSRVDCDHCRSSCLTKIDMCDHTWP
jgi:hypothetical protein